jgi:nicotinamide-nucleotide amidase
MRAEIIAIGTELLIGHTVNTNATYISEELNASGISTYYHTVVGDNEGRIIDCLKLAASRSDLVICTGGLGPTDDDISNETLAKFLGKEIKSNPVQVKILEAKFDQRGIRNIPKINYKQACVIEGATVIPNPIGTAIGMMVNYNDTMFITYPGVPCEMEAMLDYCIPLIKNTNNNSVIVSRKVKMTNITESRMAQTILDYYQEQQLPNPFLEANPSLAPYAALGDIYVRITANAATETQAKALIQTTETHIQKILDEYIYGYDDDTVPIVLARILKTQKLSIAFAESCTGGLLSKLMTDIPGSSAYTKLNLVTYSNEAKMQMLGVSPQTLEKYGAVSAECAREMVSGLSKVSKADINISVTGIAGPDGGTEEKPVGTVYLGISLVNSKDIIVEQLDLQSRRNLSREQIRELASIKTLYKIIRLLKSTDSDQ